MYRVLGCLKGASSEVQALVITVIILAVLWVVDKVTGGLFDLIGKLIMGIVEEIFNVRHEGVAQKIIMQGKWQDRCDYGITRLPLEDAYSVPLIILLIGPQIENQLKNSDLCHGKRL